MAATSALAVPLAPQRDLATSPASSLSRESHVREPEIPLDPRAGILRIAKLA